MAKKKQPPRQYISVPTDVTCGTYNFEGSEAEIVKSVHDAFQSAADEVRQANKLFELPAEWNLTARWEDRQWDDGKELVISCRRLESDEEYAKRLDAELLRDNAREQAERRQYEELSKKYGK